MPTRAAKAIVDLIAKAIVDLNNSKPRNPTQAEIAATIEPLLCLESPALETSPLAAQVRAALAAETAAREACAKLPNGSAFDEAQALCDQRHAEVVELVSRIPSPPRRIEDLVLLAEVAFHYAERDRNGRMTELDGTLADSAAARLIEAVLRFR